MKRRTCQLKAVAQDKHLTDIYLQKFTILIWYPLWTWDWIWQAPWISHASSCRLSSVCMEVIALLKSVTSSGRCSIFPKSVVWGGIIRVIIFVILVHDKCRIKQTLERKKNFGCAAETTPALLRLMISSRRGVSAFHSRGFPYLFPDCGVLGVGWKVGSNHWIT